MKNTLLTSKAYQSLQNRKKPSSSSNIDKSQYQFRFDLAEGLFYPEGMKDYAMLPDGNATRLREALSRYLKVKPEELCVFAGADEIIEIIPRIFLDEGDSVSVITPTFERLIMTNYKVNAHVLYYPLQADKQFNFTENDVDEIINAENHYKIIWLCSPNNPTGRVISLELVERLANKLENTLIVVDECYQEFYSLDSSKSCVSLIDKYPNIAVIRTFSKAFALAGIRVGYVVSSNKNIQYFTNFKTKFNVATVSQNMAVHMLEKPQLDSVSEFTNLIRKERISLVKELLKHDNITFIPDSETNFIFVRHKKKNLFQELLLKGALASNWSNGIGIENQGFVRLSLGDWKHNKKLLEIISSIN